MPETGSQWADTKRNLVAVWVLVSPKQHQRNHTGGDTGLGWLSSGAVTVAATDSGLLGEKKEGAFYIS